MQTPQPRPGPLAKAALRDQLVTARNRRSVAELGSAARDLAALQAQLDTFATRYNEQRPHRAIGRRTPAAAYAALPRAHPAGRGAPGRTDVRPVGTGRP